MSEPYTDPALQEIHDEMYSREESRPKSGIATMDQRTKLIIGAGAAGIALLWLAKRIDNKEAIIALIVGALIVLFMRGGNIQRQELTMVECMVRIRDLLKLLQEHRIGDWPQVPRGKVEISLVGRKQWFEGRSFKRSFKVVIHDNEVKVDTVYFVEVDIFTGDIISCQERPEGVDGRETKDLKYIPSYDLWARKRSDEYSGRIRR